MRKLAALLVITLLASSSASAQSRRTAQKPHDAAITNGQALSPEAAALSLAQKTWPGRPLCDDGGYRIRPCGLGGGGGGGN